MSLLDRLKKSSTIKETAVLSQSIFMNAKDMIPTKVPMINVALSGDLDGGLAPGLTLWAGPSKHFKTAFSLLLAKTYMDRYKDAVLMFYDNEFGSPKKYFEAFEIDMERVLHVPFVDIEQLKFDVVRQLYDINRGDHVFFMIDSIGNVASKKEIEDTLGQKSTADMTRAKQIKSFFRMVTPHLTMKDIPMSVVAHTYKSQDLFPKDVVSGGTGPYYSADSIFIVGRQQDKDGSDIVGYDFIINVEKSRYVREKSRIAISVSHQGGIERYSGLMELAAELGFVDNSSKGWYSPINFQTGEVGKKRRLADFKKDFWDELLLNEDFKSMVRAKYQISYKSIIESFEDSVVEEKEDNDILG